MTCRRFALLFLALALLLTLAACVVRDDGVGRSAEEPAEGSAAPVSAPGPWVKLTMGTSGVKGTYFPYGNAIASVLMGHIEGLDITVLPTNGSQDNICAIADKVFSAAIVQGDVMHYAVTGSELFIEALGGFSAVARLYPEACHIVARPDIETIADLRGKKVSIGAVGYGTAFNAVQILAAYDMTVLDVKAFNLDFAASAEAFKNGRIDAFFCVDGLPATSVTELAATEEITLLDIDDAHAGRLIELYPYYRRHEIAGGTYRGVAEIVRTVSIEAALIVSDDLSEDLVYSITKTLFECKDEIAALHPKGSYLDADSAMQGISVPFHPGANKYYYEIGVW